MMSGTSNNFVSEHIGNLILEELYSIRCDVKKEIQDLGIELAKIIGRKFNSLQSEANKIATVYNTDSEMGGYIPDTNDDECLSGKPREEIKVVGDYRSIGYHGSEEDENMSIASNQDIPLLSCDSITETNLMSSPSDNVATGIKYEQNSVESNVLEVVPSSNDCCDEFNVSNIISYKSNNDELATVNIAQATFSSSDTENNTNDVDDDNSLRTGTEQSPTFTTGKSSGKYVCSSPSENVPPKLLSSSTLIPSVTVIKCEDIEELCLVNGVTIENDYYDDVILISSDETVTPTGKLNSDSSLRCISQGKQHIKRTAAVSESLSKSYVDHLKKSKIKSSKKPVFVTQKGQVQTDSQSYESKAPLLRSGEKRMKMKNQASTKKLKPKKKKRLVCKLCGKRFSSLNLFSIHMKHSHLGNNLCPHPLCNKSFAGAASLKIHMRIHEEVCDDDSGSNSDEMMECSICNKVLFTNNMFNLHMKSHLKQSNFNCKFCSKMFFGLKKLHMHMNEHVTKTSFVCNKCGKGFCYEKSYLAHMKRHARAPLNCFICNKSFVHQRALNSHLQSFHGITLYECSVCQKAFSSQKKLHLHSKTHARKNKALLTVPGRYNLRKRT